MENAPEWILVGEVRRPHGTGGEVLVKSYSERDDRFDAGSKLFVTDRDGNGRFETEVVESRPTAKGRLLKLAGFGTRERAGTLSGSLLFIPRSELAPPKAGSYYDFQLEGASVYAGTQMVGVVYALLETAANPVLEISPAGGGANLYIPFVADVILSVDLLKRRIVIPDDFLE